MRDKPALRAVEELPDTKLPERRRDAMKALVRREKRKGERR